MPEENRTPEEIKKDQRRVKRVAKVFGQYNYTPMVAGILAGVFCRLSRESAMRKREVLNLIERIVAGQNK